MRDFVLRNVRKVICGDGSVVDNATIVMKDKRIVAIGCGISEPAGASIVDCSRLCALPGLIDTHCHVESAGLVPGADKDWSRELITIRAAAQIEAPLLTGTTTMVDGGCKGSVSFALREALAKRIIRGPRLLVSGVMIRMTGGRANWGTEGEVDGADSARRETRLMLAKGVDFVKLGATGAVSSPGMKQRSPQLTTEEMAAACEEAHNAGLKVHSHAYGDEGIKYSIDAGADVIVHGVSLNDENLSLMKSRSLMLMPTLSIYRAKQERVNELPEWQRVKTLEVWEEVEVNFRRAREAGIEMVAGTDSGMVFNYFGRSSRELDYMVEWGMAPMDAIKTMTFSAARSVGLEQEIGVLEAGRIADVLLTRGDPSEEIGVLGRPGGIASVIQSGIVTVSFDQSGKEIA